MTKEQIDLEFEHLILDKKIKDKSEVYADADYEDYDKETAKHDSQLSEIDDISEAEIEAANDFREDTGDDWEDVGKDGL